MIGFTTHEAFGKGSLHFLNIMRGTIKSRGFFFPLTRLYRLSPLLFVMSTSLQPVTCIELTVNSNQKQIGLEWPTRDMGQIHRSPRNFFSLPRYCLIVSFRLFLFGFIFLRYFGDPHAVPECPRIT